MTVSHTDIEQAMERDELTPQEMRNIASVLAAQQTDEELIAAAAGLLPGKILSSYFEHLDTRLKVARQQEAKSRADAHYLALLQAQLNSLDNEIAVLNTQIDALDRLIAIVQNGDELDPNNLDHRQLLIDSGVPEDQWDGVTLQDLQALRDDRAELRDDKMDLRADTATALANARGQTPEVVQEVVQDQIELTGAGNVHAATLLALDGDERGTASDLIHGADTSGNDARDNGASDFSLFAAGPPATPASATSAAHQYDDTNPLRGRVPDIQGHHRAAAANTAIIVQPEAQVALQLEEQAVPATPMA